MKIKRLSIILENSKIRVVANIDRLPELELEKKYGYNNIVFTPKQLQSGDMSYYAILSDLSGGMDYDEVLYSKSLSGLRDKIVNFLKLKN